MIQLAVLLPLAMSAATPAVSPTTDSAYVQVESHGGDAAPAAGEDIGFIEKYYPFTFTEGLEPEVEENFMLLYISGVLTYFLAAPIWLPLVLIGNPADWLMDSIISWIIHFIPTVIPFIGWIYALANMFYLMPVAVVNIFDRNLKAAKKAGTWAGKAAAVRPPSDSELALASMAY